MRAFANGAKRSMIAVTLETTPRRTSGRWFCARTRACWRSSLVMRKREIRAAWLWRSSAGRYYTPLALLIINFCTNLSTAKAYLCVCVCAIATTPILPRRSVLRISCIFAFLVSIAGAFHIILVLKTGIEARPRYEVVRGIDMGGGKKAVWSLSKVIPTSRSRLPKLRWRNFTGISPYRTCTIVRQLDTLSPYMAALFFCRQVIFISLRMFVHLQNSASGQIFSWHFWYWLEHIQWFSPMSSLRAASGSTPASTMYTKHYCNELCYTAVPLHHLSPL